MSRAGGDLHGRLMSALARGADAHEMSCALIDQHLSIDEDVRATLAAVHRDREQRARAGAFAIGQADERERS